jgi:SIR2-like domain
VNYEEGLILLQDFIKKRPLIIVGSGLSISMGIPGMGKLLDHLEEKLPTILEEKENIEWSESLELIRELGFEEGLLKKNISSNLLLHIIEETAKLIEIYDNEFHEKLHTLSVLDYPFAKLLNHLLISLPPDKPNIDVITTNYDHLVEYACDLIQCDCCTGFKGGKLQFFKPDNLKENLFRRVKTTQKKKSGFEYRMTSKVRLLKPHGSLNWQKINEQTIHSHKLIKNSNRVIITPGSTKFEASLTDYVMNSHRELANECLRNTESVIILGYGFNDSHLQTVLTERLKEGLDCLILTRTLSENAKKLIQSCNQIIALEHSVNLETNWYFNGEDGVWEEPIWDLAHFVKRVI